jgi:hypothetical protein
VIALHKKDKPTNAFFVTKSVNVNTSLGVKIALRPLPNYLIPQNIEYPTILLLLPQSSSKRCNLQVENEGFTQ